MQKLKLFKVEGEGAWSGAMCVIAAQDKETAAKYAKEFDSYFYTTPVSITECEGEYIGVAGIIADYDWAE